MLCQGSSRIAPQTVFQLTWCFMKTFLLKTYSRKFGTAWAIEMTFDREEWFELPIGATRAQQFLYLETIFHYFTSHHRYVAGLCMLVTHALFELEALCVWLSAVYFWQSSIFTNSCFASSIISSRCWNEVHLNLHGVFLPAQVRMWNDLPYTVVEWPYE